MIHSNNYRHVTLIFIDRSNNMSSRPTLSNKSTSVTLEDFFGEEESSKHRLLGETPDNGPFERMKSE
jgi:hypothetical protein